MKPDEHHFREPRAVRDIDKDRAKLIARSEDWLGLVFTVSQHKDPVDSLVCMYEVSEPEAEAIFCNFNAEMHGEDPDNA